MDGSRRIKPAASKQGPRLGKKSQASPTACVQGVDRSTWSLTWGEKGRKMEAEAATRPIGYPLTDGSTHRTNRLPGLQEKGPSSRPHVPTGSTCGVRFTRGSIDWGPSKKGKEGSHQKDWPIRSFDSEDRSPGGGPQKCKKKKDKDQRPLKGSNLRGQSPMP